MLAKARSVFCIRNSHQWMEQLNEKQCTLNIHIEHAHWTYILNIHIEHTYWTYILNSLLHTFFFSVNLLMSEQTIIIIIWRVHSFIHCTMEVIKWTINKFLNHVQHTFQFIQKNTRTNEWMNFIWCIKKGEWVNVMATLGFRSYTWYFFLSASLSAFSAFSLSFQVESSYSSNSTGIHMKKLHRSHLVSK